MLDRPLLQSACSLRSLAVMPRGANPTHTPLNFTAPEEVKDTGQGRCNSGLYLMSRYEVQILDSYDNKTYFDGQCGAVYKEQPPTVNACRKPGEWQTYDIIFTSPRFHSDGSLHTPGYVTVLHNGVLIHNHFE